MCSNVVLLSLRFMLSVSRSTCAKAIVVSACVMVWVRPQDCFIHSSEEIIKVCKVQKTIVFFVFSARKSPPVDYNSFNACVVVVAIIILPLKCCRWRRQRAEERSMISRRESVELDLHQRTTLNKMEMPMRINKWRRHTMDNTRWDSSYYLMVSAFISVPNTIMWFNSRKLCHYQFIKKIKVKKD